MPVVGLALSGKAKAQIQVHLRTSLGTCLHVATGLLRDEEDADK
jgi:hypothetical protein